MESLEKDEGHDVPRIPVPITAVVLVLIEDNGRYVLIQEQMAERGYPWCIPAGCVEPGETLIEAVKRETREESGLIVEPRQILRIEHIIPPHQDRQHPSRELWRFVVVAEPVGGVLKTVADEHTMQARWVRPDEIHGMKLRGRDVLELIEMHRRGAPTLPIEAYVSFVAPLR